MELKTYISIKNFDVYKSIEKVLFLSSDILKNANINVNLYLSKSITIKGNENCFIQMLLILLNNSRDAFLLNRIDNPFIDIIISKELNNISLIVNDNGGGIKEKYINNILKKGISYKGSTGLGLYIIDKIVREIFHGSLNIKNINNGLSVIIKFKVKG